MILTLVLLACSRLGANGSLREQLNISLIAVASVLLLARHLTNDTQIFQRLDGCRGGRKAGIELPANALNGEARHHRQHFKQSLTRWPRLWRLQQAFAVGYYQTGHFDNAVLCIGGSHAHTFQKESYPGLPITCGANV